MPSAPEIGERSQIDYGRVSVCLCQMPRDPPGCQEEALVSMTDTICINRDPVGGINGNDPGVESKLGTGQVRVMPDLRDSASHPERF